MTKQDDVIFGVIRNYDWPTIRPYAVSLTKSGFSGIKVFFFENITREARENLVSLGFTLQASCPTPRPDSPTFNRSRYANAVFFMKDRMKSTRYFIWTDVRDVVFQSDPSVWLEEHTGKDHVRKYHIVGSTEHILLKNEWHGNGAWAQRAAGDAYSWLQEQECCCTGVMAGTPEYMIPLLQSLILNVTRDESRGVDQGSLNYLLRIKPFKDVTLLPRMTEGFCVTCGLYQSDGDALIRTEKCPIFDRGTGLVYIPDTTTPFCIVHQYDRDLSWKAIIDNRFSRY